MAEIKHCGSFLNTLSFRYLISLVIAFYLCAQVFSQEPARGVRKVEILHSDELVVDEKIDKDLQKLLGNVQLKHNEAYMTCDSAYYHQKKNQVQAFGKIHIEQGDTLNLFGDYVFYDGNLEQASVNGNVELIDKETHLYTNAIDYDLRNKIARYNDRGKITNGDNTLTSIRGIYYSTDNLFHFKDSVKIVNPDYIMTADTMDYNTKTETAIFTGPSELVGDSLYLYCERGWYDTKTKVSRIWKNAIIDNKQQIIHGDSLYYDENTGYGLSLGNISISDTSNQIIVKGDYAWYYKKPERFMVTDSAMFIQYSKNDTLFLHADTISVVTIPDTSAKGYRLMRAYYGCRVFSQDIQGKCDSLSYSFQDSVIRLYKYPVLWSEENQLTSDSMAIFTRNRQADRMELYNSAFIASQVDTLRFNQIKGRSLIGYFRENKLYKINISGNGESIYYLLDGEKVTGVNRSTCASIEILVRDGKITDIYQYQSPEGVIDPPSNSIASNTQRLDGFSWFDPIRPKKINDIFK